jgi:hypothetical protein
MEHTKGRAIVKGEARLVFCESELGLEGVDVTPELQHILLGLGEVDAHGAVASGKRCRWEGG